LLNDEIIKWAYFIKPLASDQYRSGIVQPLNKHNGGGIEAYFENGTSAKTYYDLKPY
jgi:hypothetical protein